MLIRLQPHPVRGKEADPHAECVFQVAVERKQKDFGDEPIISFTGTDGSEDRHGSIINPAGWELSPYRANPVVLWGHQQLIHAIGKTVDLSKNGEKWDFDVRFAVEEWDVPGMGNLALLTYRLAKGDYIRATSISFIPKEWKDRKAETIPSFFAENVEYVRQELTEISVVNVPSNRHALKKALDDKVISENEADVLGLGEFFRLIPPVEVRSEGQNPPLAFGPGATVRFADTAENRANALIAHCGFEAEGTVVDVEEGRISTEFLHDHYSGLFQLPPSRFVVTAPAPEGWSVEKYLAEVSHFGAAAAGTRAAGTRAEDDGDDTGISERQAMESLAESLWQAIQEALTGFDAAEHDGFRLLCADIISYCIYRIDSLKWWGQNWYGEAPADAPVMLAAPDTAIESRARGIALERVGAVLNKANKGRLEQIKTLADEVLASAGKPEDDEDEEDRSIDLAALYASSPEGERDALANSILGAQGTGGSPDDASQRTAPDHAGDDSAGDESTGSWLSTILTD